MSPAELPRPDLPHLSSGKVREMYDAGDDRLLIVTSDRLSAFDVIMEEPIPNKGRVLTAMSAFWFEQLGELAPHHLLSTDLADLPPEAQLPELEGRVMLCKKAEILPVECIVRGYLTGSAWKEYQREGTMHGTELPEGLQESAQLPEPVFTPSTKAEMGEHDENISFEAAVELIGQDHAEADAAGDAHDREHERQRDVHQEAATTGDSSTSLAPASPSGSTGTSTTVPPDAVDGSATGTSSAVPSSAGPWADCFVARSSPSVRRAGGPSAVLTKRWRAGVSHTKSWAARTIRPAPSITAVDDARIFFR